MNKKKTATILTVALLMGIKVYSHEALFEEQIYKLETTIPKKAEETISTTEDGLRTIEDGVYVIRSKINPKFVIDINGASIYNGANAQLYEYSDVEQKKFTITYIGEGYYTIIAKHSNKSLDVKDAAMYKGANVWQWEQNDTDAQKWIIKDVGNGYFSIISKCNGLYVDVLNAVAGNSTNIQMCDGNGLDAQKFKLERVFDPSYIKSEQTIEDGIYTINSAINQNYVLEVQNGKKTNGANIQLYKNTNANRQKFQITYFEEGYYTIMSVNSGKMLDVKNAGMTKGTNVQQCESNGLDAQKWIIKDVGNGRFSIISKCNGLYVDVLNAVATNGTNIQMCDGNGLNAQKFIFNKTEIGTDNTIEIDEEKYPGYKERIEVLMNKYPNWNFELLYTGLTFNEAVKGETSVHSRNLLEKNYTGEWICQVCGTKLYDSGWYCASEKAVAYYLDPRNFLDEVNVFQFQAVDEYLYGVTDLAGIQKKVQGTFLANYANDINIACQNKDVNPYYVISRLLQEQGTKGTYTGLGMDGGDGKIYYNPFNIGATGNGIETIYANALKRAKEKGWDSMEKALEGGIDFLKINWLDIYQNTLYQNKFDITLLSGSSLYTHQYMQNLLGAYSEARTLYNMYNATNKVDSPFTFIIPIYENMPKENSPMPSSSVASMSLMNVKTTGTKVRLRDLASTNSNIIKEIEERGTVLLSIEQNINGNWQKVVTNNGTIGYVSGTYLERISDVKTCNYTAKVKTSGGTGCNVRIGPSTQTSKVTAISDGTIVTVIDNSTYINVNGYNWYRVLLPSGIQGFMPSIYLE